MRLTLDLIGTLRSWRRRPSVPLLAIVFLGGGMGAATGVFAVTDAVVWRALPLPDADRLVRVYAVDRGVEGDASPGLVELWSQRARTSDALGGLRPMQATWRDAAGTDRLEGAQASPELVRALGVSVVRGRRFGPEDVGAPVLLLTHRFWQARFGGREDALGLVVDLDGDPRTIVGILEPGADRIPLLGEWLSPLPPTAGAAVNGPRYLDVVARMRTGVSAADFTRELSELARTAGATGADGSTLMAKAVPLGETLAPNAGRLLRPLLGAVLVVLLIAAVNTANLRMADLLDRRGETAVRAALGASRGQLMAQQIGEALLLSAVAAGLGLLVAQWCVAALQALLPAEATVVAAGSITGRVLWAMFALALGVAGLTGVLPAIAFARGPLSPLRMDETRTIVGGTDRLRRGFVVAQVALAVTLAVSGAVMIQTTRRLADDARAYRSESVWTAAVRLAGPDFPRAVDIARAASGMVAAVGALPGVVHAAIASRVPLAGGAPGSDVALASEVFTPGVDRQTRVRFVTPGYFAAVGAAVRAGRDVSESDVEGREPVVLINETLAARLTPGRSPVGEFLTFAVPDFNGPSPTAWRIVGLVEDARDRGPRQPAEPEVYLSLAQAPSSVFEWIGRQLLLVVQMRPGASLAPAVLRAAVQAADPRVPAFDLQTLADRFADHVATERVLAGLLVPLAVVGLALAGFGTFAVAMHAVQRRRREIALRMVLGATPADVMRETGRAGVAIAVIGAAAGTLGAVAVSRLLRTVAYGTHELDPVVVGGVTAVVAATLAVATALPARRAAQHDPAVVLRND